MPTLTPTRSSLLYGSRIPALRICHVPWHHRPKRHGLPRTFHLTTPGLWFQGGRAWTVRRLPDRLILNNALVVEEEEKAP